MSHSHWQQSDSWRRWYRWGLETWILSRHVCLIEQSRTQQEGWGGSVLVSDIRAGSSPETDKRGWNRS